MHIRKPPDRPRRKEIPPRPASKNPAGKLAAIPPAMPPAMPQAAAALLAAALVFSLAACGGGEEPPTPYFPSRQEMEAQATAQAKHNRTVSAAAQAMTQATVEASIGSEKIGNAPTTAPPAKTPQPVIAQEPTPAATPAHQTPGSARDTKP